jgi:hypothetical protein
MSITQQPGLAYSDFGQELAWRSQTFLASMQVPIMPASSQASQPPVA